MIWNPIYLGITIVSIVVAVYFGLRSIRKKEPVFAWCREKIIGLGSNAPEELKLLFNDVPLAKVFRTTFIVFNRGRLAIRKDDIVGCLRISFDEGAILRQPIIHTKSSQSIEFLANAVVENNKHQVELEFQYLNHNDGAVFEVLHTDDTKINIDATLIDVNKIIDIGNMKPIQVGRMKYLFGSFIGFCALFGWAIHGAVTMDESSTTTGEPLSIWVPLVIAFAITWLLTFMTDVREFYRYYRFPSWSRAWLKRR